MPAFFNAHQLPDTDACTYELQLRGSIHETVEELHPLRRAISRIPMSWACGSPISSRSATDKHPAETGFDIDNDTLPRCWSQRVTTASNTPATSAALDSSSLSQSAPRTVAPLLADTTAQPANAMAPRPLNFCIHPAGYPMYTSLVKVLRRSAECAQYVFFRYSNRPAEGGNYRSVGSWYDWHSKMLMKTFNGLRLEE